MGCRKFKELNNETVKDAYLIPSIDDLIYRLHQLEIATIFDSIEGYNKLEILEHISFCVHLPQTVDFSSQMPSLSASLTPRQVPAYDERITWRRKRQVLLSIQGRSFDILECSRCKFQGSLFRGLFSIIGGRVKIEEGVA